MNIIRLLLFASIIPVALGTAQPKLAIDKPEIDLGVVWRGTVKKATFTIKNIGSEPLKILQMVPSCGCTTIKRPKDTLAPGESDNVEVEFSSATFRGRVESKRVDIMTNDPTAEYATVKLVADVREELAPTEGSSLVWFGTAPVGKPAEQKITFKNLTDRVIVVKGFTAPTGRVTLTWDKKKVNPQEDLTLVVKVNIDKEGYTADHVDLDTDSKNQPKVMINVSFIGVKGS